MKKDMEDNQHCHMAVIVFFFSFKKQNKTRTVLLLLRTILNNPKEEDIASWLAGDVPFVFQWVIHTNPKTRFISFRNNQSNIISPNVYFFNNGLERTINPSSRRRRRRRNNAVQIHNINLKVQLGLVILMDGRQASANQIFPSLPVKWGKAGSWWMVTFIQFWEGVL